MALLVDFASSSPFIFQDVPLFLLAHISSPHITPSMDSLFSILLQIPLSQVDPLFTSLFPPCHHSPLSPSSTLCSTILSPYVPFPKISPNLSSLIKLNKKIDIVISFRTSRNSRKDLRQISTTKDFMNVS